MSECSTVNKLSGFAFDNPDYKSSYLAPKWGLLVTADELRYDELFGNELIAESNSYAIQNETLLEYGRMAIAYLERELNIDILPRLIRYQDQIGANGETILRSDIDDAEFLSRIKKREQLNLLYIREPGYPYRPITGKHELRIKLRRRPVRDILTAVLVDPYRATALINLMPYRMLKAGYTGVCYFRPNAYKGGGYSWNSLWSNYFSQNTQHLQNIFLIDYTSGFENVADVPGELRHICRKIAAITLMSTYGDGKFAAVASRSVSLNSVSESIGTTMSATSAAFGARILQYQNEIKTWLSTNRTKYSNSLIGYL